MWYVLESFDDALDYKDGKILAISPEACYGLDKRGIHYSTPEDFYSEKELFKPDDTYFIAQLQWFEGLDQLFKDNIAYCKEENMHLGIAHFFRIKCLIDSIVIYSRIFNKFFEHSKPDKILYVCDEKRGSKTRSIYEPFAEQRHIIPSLIEKICEKHRARFDIRMIRSSCGDSVIPEAKEMVKDFLKKCHFKSAYYFFKYTKLSRFFSFNGRKNVNVLSLHAGVLTIDFLIKNLIANGSSVFLKSDKEINRINTIFQKKSLDLNSAANGDDSFAEQIKKGCKNVYMQFLQKKELAGWINDRCGIDVLSIIQPYFKDLIENICFHDLVEVPALKNFYKNEKIDFIISRTGSEKETVSSLLAAAQSKQRVCFQHSCSVFDAKQECISELHSFDYYFAMHDEQQSYMNENLKHGYSNNCRVFQDPRHVRTMEKKWRRVHRDSRSILYIPAKLFLGFRIYDARYLYPLTWYFKLQKDLVDMFAANKKFKFIFKYALGQEWSKNSILLYIKDKGYSNISIETKPVSDCLGKAGRVILDFPSTSLYETAAAKLPVMSLYPDMIKIRDLSLKIFGKSLQKFHDIPEAVRIAENFINDDPGQYVVDLPFSEQNSFNVLKDIKYKTSRI